MVKDCAFLLCLEECIMLPFLCCDKHSGKENMKLEGFVHHFYFHVIPFLILADGGDAIWSDVRRRSCSLSSDPSPSPLLFCVLCTARGCSALKMYL